MGLFGGAQDCANETLQGQKKVTKTGVMIRACGPDMPEWSGLLLRNHLRYHNMDM